MNIYVLTSNEYLHCLQGFIYLFNKYWNTSQEVKVIRYDIRPRGLPVNFTHYAIGDQDQFSWSSGVVRWLSDVEDDVFLLMLEDYFISEPVDVERIEGLYQLMLDDDSICKIDLTNDRLKFAHRKHGKHLIESLPTAAFQTSLQAALWRRDYLQRFLVPSEGPWQYEKKGTKRVKVARKAGDFDGVILGCKQPPLRYVNAIGGEGNKPKRYDRKKFPTELWDELSAKRMVWE